MMQADVSMRLPPVPARLGAFEPDLAQRLVAELESGGPALGDALAWAEKARRFVELNRLRVVAVARQRFGAAWAPALAGMAAVLTQAAEAAARGDRPDLCYLNAALTIADHRRRLWAALTPQARAVFSAAVDRCEALTVRLPAILRAAEPWPVASAMNITERIEQAPPQDFSVVIFCPNPYSLYTIAVTTLLLRQGIKVKGVILRRMLTPSRIRQELRRDGKRLLRKVWRKLVLRGDENPGEGPGLMRSLLEREGITCSDVRVLAAENGIPALAVTDYAEAALRDFLRQARPSYGVFTGGGLVPAPVLAACGGGVINCHLGILPQYKGMDVVQWPILEGAMDHVGITAHLMDAGLDTGPVLAYRRWSLTGPSTLGRLRNELGAQLPEVMVATVAGLRQGRLQPYPQPPAGRQYFIVHDRLAALIDPLLRECP